MKLIPQLLLMVTLACPAVLRAGVDSVDNKDLKAVASIREPEAPERARFWITPEYVHYWQNTTPRLPALLSHTDAADIVKLGTYYGDRGLNWDNGNGAKLTMGAWLDPQEKIGIELTGFYIPQQKQTSDYRINGNLIDAFFNDYSLTPPVPVSNLFPSYPAGQAQYTYGTQQYGGELNGLYHVGDWLPAPETAVNVDLLGGFRYFGEKDTYSNYYAQPQHVFPVGNSYFYDDYFNTSNNFYGGNLGAHVRVEYHRFFAELTPKIALGVTDESVGVSGSSRVTNNPGPGGFYSSGNKAGHRSAQPFAFLPQITLKLGYDFNKNIEAFVGYDALYLSEIARVQNQISTNLDANTLPGYNAGGGPDTSPVPSVQSNELFEQGVTAGLTFKL